MTREPQIAHARIVVENCELRAQVERLKAGLAQIEKSYPRATTTALRRMARAILAAKEDPKP
jgi:uncharacterized protein YqfA (UPF0365 family)